MSSHPAQYLMKELLCKKMILMGELRIPIERIEQEANRDRQFVARLNKQQLSLPDERSSYNENSIMVPNELYDQLMSEVMSMPIKKRKNYRSFLIDNTGEKTKVIYEDDVLKNWSTLKHHYCKIVPKSVYPEKELIYATDFAKFNALNDEMNFMAPIKFQEWWVDNITHTGNHTGRVNYRQSVPTAAGQPCRA